MESKKAEGLSINVIVIAILALIVLLVVVMVFSGKMNSLIPSLSQETCQARSGYCRDKDTLCNNNDMKVFGMGCPKKDVDPDKNEYCCYPAPAKK